MQCDLCGKTTELFLVELEGSKLTVCKNCGKHGKVIQRIKTKEEQAQETKQEQKRIKTILQQPQRELLQLLVDDYPQKIKSAREKLGLSQEDFAKHINEKASLIHHIETGKFEPPISLARKLEKALHIALVEEHEELPSLAHTPHGSSLTIGDIISVKRR